MTDAVDWDDPCATYAALRAAYLETLKGGVKRTSFTSGGEVREVEFTTSNTDRLREEMNIAHAACQRLTGGASSRSAIGSGGIRPRRYDWPFAACSGRYWGF